MHSRHAVLPGLARALVGHRPEPPFIDAAVARARARAENREEPSEAYAADGLVDLAHAPRHRRIPTRTAGRLMSSTPSCSFIEPMHRARSRRDENRRAASSALA
jgi:hypothetical protein